MREAGIYMKTHEKKLKSYKRNHKGSNLRDDEESKIKKEIQSIQKMMRKSKKIPITDDYESRDAYDELMTKIKKTKGNRKSHKTRLTELEKNDDFL